MILVITGSEASLFEFNRLIGEMDDIAKDINEDVFIQMGNIDNAPKYAKYFNFLPDKEFSDLCERARLIICHAGIGSIMTSFNHNKSPILVPRMKKFNEHIDDHQLEIAEEFRKSGIATVIYDVTELRFEIAREKRSAYNAIRSDSTNLSRKLKDYLKNIEMRHPYA